jgi:hypothetical protein
MKTKIISGLGILFLIGIGYVSYLWFMPHRDVQATTAFKTIEASALVNEFLSESEKANNLYLDAEGESKVLIVQGRIDNIQKDQLGQYVVLLKNAGEKMGVSSTFLMDTNYQVENLSIGDNIKIKGVIRSGAEFDEDLDLAENVILEKCALIK